jgi:diguanylate cyclase (GGDEF)-like protein
VSKTILAHARQVAGEDGVQRLLAHAACAHTVEYLEDVGNWIGFDEAVALWDAGEVVTQDPNFARHAGEYGLKALGGTATATVLRSLGSIEEHLSRLKVSGNRWGVATEIETLEVGEGYAEVRAVASPGFVRSRQNCEWTGGMLSISPTLFGLPPARVEHSACQALGAQDCRYHLAWSPADQEALDNEQIEMLRGQLEALSKRMEGVAATASDLISADDLDDTLGRIAHRAAQQVRAPKYLLAVRPSHAAEVSFYQSGLDEDEARAIADRVSGGEQLPESWCAAEIRSSANRYGWLVAMYHEGAQFLPAERELLELYARYAATALDGAKALLEARINRDEAQRRDDEARALLVLARGLASAGTSDEIAARLAETVPAVVDCDRVSVWLWDDELGENVRRAVNSAGDGDEAAGPVTSYPSEVPQLAVWLKQPDPEPYFIDMDTSVLKPKLEHVRAVAAVAVPIATNRRFLGTLFVSVRGRPERLADTPELRERLSGVAAHAVTALENGRLVDHITHQARHDQLTGLANRLTFGERMTAATQPEDRSEPFAVFYIDLDRFKPINDEFGHELGDGLLRAVAERLTACARSVDTVARLGGDEFAIIVDAIADEAQLAPIGERFAQAFRSPFLIDGHRLVVQASIGHAVWPVDASDADGLLRKADAAMYRAKRSRHSDRRAHNGRSGDERSYEPAAADRAARG